MTVDEIKSKYGVAQADAVPNKTDAKNSKYESLRFDIDRLVHAVDFYVEEIARDQKDVKDAENKFKSLIKGLTKEDLNRVRKHVQSYKNAQSLPKYVK